MEELTNYDDLASSVRVSKVPYIAGESQELVGLEVSEEGVQAGICLRVKECGGALPLAELLNAPS